MGKPQAPTPPDPQETAAAATGTNISTAIANTLMGQTGQTGPMGSVSYDQTGMQTITDPYTGQTYDIPQFSANMELAPELQGITGHIGDLVGGLGQGGDVDQRLMDMGRQRLDPILEQERNRLTQSLADRGLQPGSAAWEAEQGAFNQRQNDAYNQLLLTGRGQAINEQMAPIQQISALLGAQSGAAPNFGFSQPSRVPTVDVGGLIGDNYNRQVDVYDQQMKQRQGLLSSLGGLFGLGV